MPEADLETLLSFFKAMANESRLRIVGLLAERERSVQELAETIGVKEPTVSHHLAVLKQLGLVSSRAEGVTRWYALRPETLTEFNRTLFDQDRVSAMTAPKQSWEEKVRSTFIQPDGRFIHLPSSRRKRWVLLKGLAEAFEDGRRYPEAEVNEILQRSHWDSATMRREMIGWRMLTRDKGVYWRLPKAEWVEA
jgi:hypothetical protein